MTRPNLLLPVLLVAATAWLAGGPGGVTVQALAACWHHHGASGAHAAHNHELPPGTPCFCDAMTGSHDVLLAPASPAPTVTVSLAAVLPQFVPFAPPQSPVPSFVQAPTPPPPNPLG